MASVDRTSDLLVAFQHAQRHLTKPISQVSAKRASIAATDAMNSLSVAFRAVDSAFRTAQTRSKAVIHTTLAVLDDFPVGGLDDVDSQLAEVAAMLQSTESLVRQFNHQIAAQLDQIGDAIQHANDAASHPALRVQGDGDRKRAGGLWSEGVLQAAMQTSARLQQLLLSTTPRRFGASTDVAKELRCCRDLLAHFASASDVMQQHLQVSKLALRMCEEELIQFTRDSASFLSFGSVGDNALMKMAPVTESTPAAAVGRSLSGDGLQKTENTVSLNTPASLVVAGLRKGVQVLSSQQQRLSTAATAGAKFVLGETGLRRGADDAESPDALDPSRHVNFSDAERAEFSEERKLLTAQFSQSSAKEAQEVEASARELSLVTAMLSEHSLMQTEQIALVAKNSDEAHRNIAKAESELLKTVAQDKGWFWSGTRQLIVALWCATAFILVAHIIVR